MEADDYQKAWGTLETQSQITIDMELLRTEVERSQSSFRTQVFWRDAREIGISVIMILVWGYLGVTLSLPWTWYLTIPVLMWYAIFMFAYRKRRKTDLVAGEPLVQCVESSLDQVELQIWLLRNVLWWAILPIAVAFAAFVGQIAWLSRSGGWLTVVIIGVVVAVVSFVLAMVYWVNRLAVKKELQPRRRELLTLMKSLEDSQE